MFYRDEWPQTIHFISVRRTFVRVSKVSSLENYEVSVRSHPLNGALCPLERPLNEGRLFTALASRAVNGRIVFAYFLFYELLLPTKIGRCVISRWVTWNFGEKIIWRN